MADYTELVKDLLHCATSGEACASCNRKNERDCQDHLQVEAADAIEELQGTLFLMKKTAEFVAEKVPKWIPVTERLPGREWVLCKCQANIHDILSLRDGYWYHDPQHKYMGDFVTHWMPLPEPPKEAENV